ncbi:hypothetical protein WMY93_022358 [Mugilogobius chulae]|uniref:C-type lectin domain-containing protein n=1 Tax=Mugilogobius chulae TaxID=88201 RepID=A0AAW0N6S3_9GOBI
MEVRRPDLEFLLLLLVFPAASWKYVPVSRPLNWNDARLHCTTTYTDLAPVSNGHDRDFLMNFTGIYWIGLMRNTKTEEYGNANHPFFCYKVHAIRERKTWYEALDYCRQNTQKLASVASETEMMLIQKELRKELSSHNVWIGLQFLAGEWVWVDGQTFSYESWGPDPKKTCPILDQDCGAIQVKGIIEKVGTDYFRIVDGVEGKKIARIIRLQVNDKTKSKHPPDHDKTESKHPPDHDKTESKHPPDQDKTKSKHPPDQDKTKSKHPPDHDKTESKHPPDQDKTESKHPPDQDKTKSKHPPDHDKTESKHPPDQDKTKSKHPPDQDKTLSKHPPDHDKTESKRSPDRDKTEMDKTKSKRPRDQDKTMFKHPRDQNNRVQMSLGPRSNQDQSQVRKVKI